MKVVIIGTGPAGLSCAYALVKKGVAVELYESSPFVGGMSRSFDLWEQRVDMGPHRFYSKEKHVNQFFNELVKEEFTIVNRLTRIHYRNRFFQYPLKLGNVFRNLGPLTIAHILWDYLKQKIKPNKNPVTFEDWVTNRFGKKLFETFFKSYSEKLWGIPCSKIDANWAAQRIKTLSLFGAIKHAILDNKDKHKTLVDEFVYPNGGTGALYEKCADFIRTNGGTIHLNTAVKSVFVDEAGKIAKGVVLVNGTTIEADHVISTMPLTQLIKGFEGVPAHVATAAGQLYFRNTILVYLEVKSTDLFADNWIYVHSSEVRHGRITNFRNWSPSLYKDAKSSILCVEFWAFEENEIWNMKDEVISALAIKEIRSLSIFPEEIPIERTHVLRIPKSYPVYEIGYQEHLDILENYLSEFSNITPIGRYGAFKYNNQDHSILMGILAAENITDGSKINLWDINTDTEYQEEGSIKDVLT